MKKTLLLLALLVTTSALFAQEKKKTVPAKPGSMQQQRDPKSASPSQAKPDGNNQDLTQAVMMEYMKPGPNHQKLAATSGEWKESIVMWMSPDAPPVKYAANCVISMILDGRYQEAIHSGNFDGMEFYGHGIIGYDNAIRKYVSIWYDNMGTGIMYTEGTYDEKAQTITFTGEMVDPMLRKKVKVREVLTLKSDNEQMFEMYVTPPDGKEYKSMEIVMIR